MDYKNYIGQCQPIPLEKEGISKLVYDMQIEHGKTNHSQCQELMKLAMSDMPSVYLLFLNNHVLELDNGDKLLFGEVLTNFGDFFDIFCGIKISDWVFCIHIFKDHPKGIVVGHHADRFYVFREIDIDDQGKFRNEYIQWFIDVIKSKLS